MTKQEKKNILFSERCKKITEKWKKWDRCNKPIYDAEMAYVGKYYHEKCYDEEMKEI